MRRAKRRDPLSVALRVLVWAAAAVTVGVLVLLVGYIFIMGIPNLSPELFAWEYTSDNCSMMPALMGTLAMTGLSLLIAAPLGIFSAIYLVEYAPKSSRLVKVVRMTSETLQGIPSIIYGLFGMVFFTALRINLTLLSGALTLSLMVLPLILRTTEEALLSIPDSYREGSFGLGAGRLRTVFRIVLPSAVPGILSGIILATGRIVGETAALMYTAGTAANHPETLMTSVRTLSVHMYVLSGEGLHIDQAYATAAVLLAVVAGINALSSFIAKRLNKGVRG